MTFRKSALIALIMLCSLVGLSQEPGRIHNLMPVPASLRFHSGRLSITPSFTVAVKGHSDVRLTAAIDRMARRLEARTGLTFARGLAGDASTASLVIQCQGPGKAIPAVDEDESYLLEVANTQSTLSAPTVVGAIRGLETFLQLLGGDKEGFFIPGVSVQDKPRFPWRGLMIDIGRHWQPMEVIKRNLDGMAAVKLNVLHLHITEDQGFRIESKKYPELHQLGSDGNYYTQTEMREIIEYARMRGIRVVPEFDMPGHTTSWFVSHPELASKPGPYQIERKWGIFEPVMDASNEQLYKLLDGFLGEMAALFPDAYLHIGGDEVEGKDWKENSKIQAFIQAKGLKDNHGFQAYFNQRLLKILQKHGKKMIGWDEALHPDLPKDIVVQSWRGPQSLADAAKKGYQGILSNGFYIDLIQPGWQHYLNEPIPDNSTLAPEERKFILGGEATMWSEWTSPETIDSRIWPRTAAIAERLWSPRETRDVDDMYRRLAVVSVQLEDVGLLHERNQSTMIRRLLGELANREEAVESLKALVDALEPVKGYKRGQMQQATQFTPLTRLADVTRPDSQTARKFANAVDQFLYKDLPRSRELAREEKTTWRPDFATLLFCAKWKNAGALLANFTSHFPSLSEAGLWTNNLVALGTMGDEALKYIMSDQAPTEEWRTVKLAQLEELAKPKAAVELVIVQPVRELVIAAAEQEKRKTMSVEDWKNFVKATAAPKKPSR